MFLYVLVTALSINLAFFATNTFGYLALFVPLLLYGLLKRDISFRASWWLSLLVFGPHFYWVALLLRTTGGTSTLRTLIIYAIVVLGFALPTMLWLRGTATLMGHFGRIGRVLVFITACIALNSYLQHYSLWFAGRSEGYPLIDLLIPLTTMREQPSPFVYLQPDAKDALVHDPGVVGQRIYQKLAALGLDEDAIVVAPESTFPFPLNEHPEIVQLWATVLPRNAHLLIGSQRKEGDKFYQTVYWIHERRIKDYYDKQHRVLFTEGVPEIFANTAWAKNLFLKDKTEISVGTQGPRIFEICGNRIRPLMCSELFMRDKVDLAGANLVLWLVNDSWFPPYLCNLLMRLAQVKANTLGVPVVYVTHERAVWLQPRSLRSQRRLAWSPPLDPGIIAAAAQ